MLKEMVEDPGGSNLSWTADGPNGKHDNINSEAILMEYLILPGWYVKYVGNNNEGTSNRIYFF
jgi:hypothetical protein